MMCSVNLCAVNESNPQAVDEEFELKRWTCCKREKVEKGKCACNCKCTYNGGAYASCRDNCTLAWCLFALVVVGDLHTCTHDVNRSFSRIRVVNLY